MFPGTSSLSHCHSDYNCPHFTKEETEAAWLQSLWAYLHAMDKTARVESRVPVRGMCACLCVSVRTGLQQKYELMGTLTFFMSDLKWESGNQV